MLTREEKRFIRYWEEQRTGGRWAYYLLYILAGTFVTSVIVAFLMAVFSISVAKKIWIIVLISFIVTAMITILAWYINENKWKKIIRREIEKAETIGKGQ